MCHVMNSHVSAVTQGLRGDKGEAGNPGLPGFSGPKGPAVSSRFQTFYYQSIRCNSHITCILILQGPPGPIGPEGKQVSY